MLISNCVEVSLKEFKQQVVFSEIEGEVFDEYNYMYPIINMHYSDLNFFEYRNPIIETIYMYLKLREKSLDFLRCCLAYNCCIWNNIL